MGFAGLDRPGEWPPLRSTSRPEALDRSLENLAGVGPALMKKLAKLGLRSVGDLLLYAPHRYETAVPERAIADLLAGEEATIAGEIRRVSVRRPRRNLAIVQARVADESDEITAVWFNQAWLAERLQPGTRVRLRGQLKRNGFQVRSYDLNGVSATADFAPVYPASEEVTPKRLRALVELRSAARARRAGPAPGRAEGPRGAAAARRRARRAAPSALARGGRDGPEAARVRRAARAPGRPGACAGGP